MKKSAFLFLLITIFIQFTCTNASFGRSASKKTMMTFEINKTKYRTVVRKQGKPISVHKEGENTVATWLNAVISETTTTTNSLNVHVINGISPNYSVPLGRTINQKVSEIESYELTFNKDNILIKMEL